MTELLCQRAAAGLPARPFGGVLQRGNRHQLAMVEPPQYILDTVRAPAEIGCVPAEEVLIPIGQQLWIVGGPPATGNGIAFEVDVDAVARLRAAKTSRPGGI